MRRPPRKTVSDPPHLSTFPLPPPNAISLMKSLTNSQNFPQVTPSKTVFGGSPKMVFRRAILARFWLPPPPLFCPPPLWLGPVYGTFPLLNQRAEGSIRRGWIGVLGAPRFSVQRSQNTCFKVFQEGDQTTLKPPFVTPICGTPTRGPQTELCCRFHSNRGYSRESR